MTAAAAAVAVVAAILISILSLTEICKIVYAFNMTEKAKHIKLVFVKKLLLFFYFYLPLSPSVSLSFLFSLICHKLWHKNKLANAICAARIFIYLSRGQLLRVV